MNAQNFHTDDGFGPRHGGKGFGPGRPHRGGGGRGRGDLGLAGPRGRRGHGRGRRGEVRRAILALLAELDAQDKGLNGYGLISAIREKTQGLWTPSAGSIYPALGLLTDEGLIVPVEQDEKQVHRLTDKGRRHVAEHADELADPWQRVVAPQQGLLDLRGDMERLSMAVDQVLVAGEADQISRARSILESARRDVYRLLAGDLEG